MPVSAGESKVNRVSDVPAEGLASGFAVMSCFGNAIDSGKLLSRNRLIFRYATKPSNNIAPINKMRWLGLRPAVRFFESRDLTGSWFDSVVCSLSVEPVAVRFVRLFLFDLRLVMANEFQYRTGPRNISRDGMITNLNPNPRSASNHARLQLARSCPKLF